MLSSLGFDTILVNNFDYSDESLSKLFAIFYPCGVKNFVFLSEFELSSDSFSLQREKIKQFKSRLKRLAPRFVHCEIFYDLTIDQGSAFNPEIKRLYASKRNSSIICSLPIMLDSRYDSIAKDVNRLLYRLKAFPVFSNFDTVLSTSNLNFCFKLVKDVNAAYAIDVHHIFDADKFPMISTFLKYNARIIPKVSKDIDCYDSDIILSSAELLMSKIGKNSYYRFCSNCTRGAAKIGF